MRLADFDYKLPQELIAQEPVSPRDSSRLLVFHRDSKEVEHRRFKDIVKYLNPGDLLVLNDTRVIPARLLGIKETGGKVEVLLLKRVGIKRWEALVKPAKRVKLGTRITFGIGELKGKIIDIPSPEKRTIEFDFQGVFAKILKRIGRTPLPPYIKRQGIARVSRGEQGIAGESRDQGSRIEALDREKYQTVYAKEAGAIAAPTAGLHFTERLLSQLKSKGIITTSLTLHVSWGTFQPIRGVDFRKHRLDPEYYRISQKTAELINQAREEKGRIVSVGTTVVRALEANAYPTSEGYRIRAKKGWTDLFIHPPYDFKIVDVLITNFHLPKTTLIMLATAFAGRENLLKTYREAIDKGYRFYSFGDAMLII